MAQGDALSSDGTVMYLSKGGAVSFTVVPTAISKANPTKVTAPPPATTNPPPITVQTVAAGVATSMTLSADDYARLGASVTLAGGVGEWAELNGVQTATKTGSNTFTVAVDSSAFVDPVPPTGTITGTLPAVPGAFRLGDIVVPRDVGFAELDGSYFVIKEVLPDGFTMLGADTSASAGVLSPIAEMDIYQVQDIVKACLNNFAFNLETPGTISAGTYCNPQFTLPSTATGVGTATLGGWINKDDPAYQEILKAKKDKLTRVFLIVLAQAQGVIIAPLVITGTTWEIPLEGGMAFTSTANLKAEPVHLF